jgi:predicted methyltransferase
MCSLPSLLLMACLQARAQEQSVKPGINDSFLDPDVDDFVGRFEVESREVFANRQAVVAACELQPGMVVADIGAGTGLFTRLFSPAVGQDGLVIAVDISQKFLDHIDRTARAQDMRNIHTRLATADSTNLPRESLDVAFLCDVYHHFEFPLKSLRSLHAALKPGGRLILIDFKRIEGQSSDWTLNHVRAGQEVFEREIQESGFKKIGERQDLFQENYFVVFEKQHGTDGDGR